MTQTTGANPNPLPSHGGVPDLEKKLAPEVSEFSTTNLKRLQAIYGSDPLRVVSFVGAGVSKPLGIKDWRSLMGVLLEEADSEEIKSAYADILNAEDSENVEEERFPQIADEIFQDIGHERFTEIIRREMEARAVPCTSFLEDLVFAVRQHLTTNFDRSIEEAYRRNKILAARHGSEFHRTPTIKCYTQATEFPASEIDDWLCYLHANFDGNAPIYIIREPDYKRFYENSSVIRDCLKRFYTRNNIVFVGFSFQDPFVLNCIRDIASEFRREQEVNRNHFQEWGQSDPHKQRTPEHFLLIDSSTHIKDWNPRAPDAISESQYSEEQIKQAKDLYFTKWREMGILPIIYREEDHTFVADLFEDLAQKRRARQ